MRYEEHPPPDDAAELVACLWTLIGTTRRSSFDLILPDGRPELVVHRGDVFRRRLASGATRPQPRRIVVGQMTGAVAIAPGRRVETVGVRFTPVGLSPLCPFPQARLADRLVSVAALKAPLLDRLTRGVLAADDVDDALGVLGRGLSDAYAHRPAVDPRVLAAVARITASHGTASMAAITRDGGLSSRSLERRFQAAVGLSPKRLARLVRFRRAVSALDADPARGGAGVALDHGYYDQAHFIAEFRAFAGSAPRRFVDRRLAELTRFFVDRPPAE